MKRYLVVIEGRLQIAEGESPLKALRYATSHWVPSDFDGRDARVYELGPPVVLNVNEVKP